MFGSFRMVTRVYLDCEFQTFRIHISQDKLGPAGFAATEQIYGYKPGDEHYKVYHFVLSLGLIVTDGKKRDYYLATFPSLFSEQGFTNGMLLEPGYTVCNPLAEKAIKDLRDIIYTGKPQFPYYESLDTYNQVVFFEINNVYNQSLTYNDFNNNSHILSLLNDVLIPSCTLVHKGHNDKTALFNTFRQYGIPMNEIKSLDLDHKSHIYNKLGVGTKLVQLKNYFVKKYSLENLEKEGMAEINSFLSFRYGPASNDAVAHNPLVDCLYTMLVEIGSDKQRL